MKKIEPKIEQVQYLGKWVPKMHFRVFVYSKDGEKLVNNYHEYKEAIASGIWFSKKEDVPQPKLRKVKADGANSQGICE